MVHQSLNYRFLWMVLIILIEAIVVPVSLDSSEYANVLFPLIFVLHFIIIAIIIQKRSKLYEASFIFVIYFLIHQIINPLLYASGLSWVGEGEFLLGNWDLIHKGFAYSLLGLTSYCIGGQIVNRKQNQNQNQNQNKGVGGSVGWLKDERVAPLVIIMFIIAIVSWAIMFCRMGFPLEVLEGRPPMERARDDTAAFGFGYFLEAIFASNIALLAYIIRSPRNYIISKYFILMVAIIFLLNGLRGSRLILIGLILSIVMMQRLIESKELKGESISWAGKIANTVRVFAGAFILMVASIYYIHYRTGGTDYTDNDLETMIFYITNTFDTAVTYYMVLDRVPAEVDYWGGCSLLAPILFRIPTIIIPFKYEIICASAKFTYQFYGYDQNLSGTIARGPNLFAELYLNFGVTAIVIVMFILGYLNEKFTQKVKITSSRIFSIIYIIYVAYLIPYSFKSGLIDAVTYADVKLALIPIGMTLVMVIERVFKQKNKNLFVSPYGY